VYNHDHKTHIKIKTQSISNENAFKDHCRVFGVRSKIQIARCSPSTIRIRGPHHATNGRTKHKHSAQIESRRLSTPSSSLSIAVIYKGGKRNSQKVITTHFHFCLFLKMTSLYTLFLFLTERAHSHSSREFNCSNISLNLGVPTPVIGSQPDAAYHATLLSTEHPSLYPMATSLKY